MSAPALLLALAVLAGGRALDAAPSLLKSRAIEDAQRAAIERQRAAEAEARRHAGRRGRDR